MVAVAMLVNWLGYQQLIWGYCIVKGYDVSWGTLASPVKVYNWPKPPGKPPLIPAGQIFPTNAKQAKVVAQVAASPSPPDPAASPPTGDGAPVGLA